MVTSCRGRGAWNGEGRGKKIPAIVDLSLKLVIFHSYVSLPEGIKYSNLPRYTRI